MRLPKYGDACVRPEAGGRVLVIDPGVHCEGEALSGATAVLITHEHADHVDVDELEAARSNPAVTIHTHPALAADLGAGVTPVEVGYTFTAAGFPVRAVGGEHAEIIDGLRRRARARSVPEPWMTDRRPRPARRHMSRQDPGSSRIPSCCTNSRLSAFAQYSASRPPSTRRVSVPVNATSLPIASSGAPGNPPR